MGNKIEVELILAEALAEAGERRDEETLDDDEMKFLRRELEKADKE